MKATIDYGQGGEVAQFLLCTSCTISYVFGLPGDFSAATGKTEQMTFKEGAEPVPVTFVSQDL